MAIESSLPLRATRRPAMGMLETMLLLCASCLVVDIGLFGPGFVIPGVGVSLRRILFMGLLALCVLRHLVRRQDVTRHELLMVLALVGFLSLWAGTLPRVYGFAPSDGVADALPWLSLLVLALWPWDAWVVPSGWTRFTGFVSKLAGLLALIHIVVWVLITAEIITRELLALITLAISGSDDGQESLIRVAFVNGSARVYWSSSVFMLCGLYFLTVDRKTYAGRRFSWLLQVGLILFALWTTQIRAFLGTVAIFLVGAYAIRKIRILAAPQLATTVTLLAWIGCVAAVSVAINPQVLESVGLARNVSDVTRLDQAEALLARFAAHPLLGSGFGSYASAVVRAADASYSYELVFYALLMKLGTVGMVALIGILYLTLVISHLPTLARVDPHRYSSWVAFTAGFWFAGATNPITVNIVGMGILVILLMDARYVSSAGAPDA